jgi:tetratricopeptide (TPR) repeat protein
MAEKEFEEPNLQEEGTDEEIKGPSKRKGQKAKKSSKPSVMEMAESSPKFYLHSMLLIGGRILNRMLDFYNSFFDLTHKDKAKIYRNIAMHYVNRGQAEKAVNHLKEWTRVEPSNTEAYYQLGIALVAAENYKSALGVFGKVLKMDPKHKGSLYRKSVLHVKLKAFSEAIEGFEQFLALHPDHAKAYYFLGIAYDRSDQLDKAVEAMKKAVELDPHEVKHFQHLGFLYERMGDHKEAARCFSKVMELEQEHEDEEE